jgi:hypothetical protein
MGDFDGDGLGDSSDACPIAPGGGNGCPADAPAPPPDGGQTGSVPTTGSASESGATPLSTATPATGTVTVSVLPASSCVSRSVFKVRINARRAHLKTGRLTLNRHRLRLVKGPRIWTARVDLRRGTRTRHTLTLRGTLRDGRPYKQVRRYRTGAR